MYKSLQKPRLLKEVQTSRSQTESPRKGREEVKVGRRDNAQAAHNVAEATVLHSTAEIF